jgi:putative DNA primase/helicase
MKESGVTALDKLMAKLGNEPSSEPQRPGNSLIVIRGDQATEKPLRWMWKPYLPSGKLVHFGGNSSQAKSPVTVDLAARISTGALWPDGTSNDKGARSVVLLNIEDDLEDTILPRFRLAGGDKSKLYYVKDTRITLDESESLERSVSLDSDMQKLAELARSLPDLGLIVVDPITNYLGGKKMIVEEDIRSILTPLASLAAELGIVVITVGHFNRREKGTDPMHRMMGAAAFVGVARAVYAFGPDPDDESKYCHCMTVVRSCGGEGSALRYRTELVEENCPDSFPTEIVRVVWTGKSNATAEDSVDPLSAKEKSSLKDAADLLLQFLGNEAKPAAECEEFLKGAGYDPEKVNTGDIRKKAGVVSKRNGSCWQWSRKKAGDIRAN